MPAGTPAPGTRTIYVDRYTLGYDVPLLKRYVAVDRHLDGGSTRVDVRDHAGRWRVDRDGVSYRPISGGTPDDEAPPRWLFGVLEWGGLDSCLEGR